MRAFSIFLILLLSIPVNLQAKQGERASQSGIYEERNNLYDTISLLTGIPWTYLASVDQYERTLTIANKKTRPLRDGRIAIHYTEELWAGPLNPDKNTTDPRAIALFGGVGLDGDGDGFADRYSDVDVLYTMARHIQKYGTSLDDFRLAIWEYYHNSRAVDRVIQFARIYSAYDNLSLDEYTFPVPFGTKYSYRDNWGASRGFGGRRIHEGTDIFAGYGVPVRSTCYGIVEMKGWNRYGGWRIGIRSINNIYHYYAHLSGYHIDMRVGKVVKPGEVIGWVGSSGYGKPGTSGKFPPHLHYGLYRDAGYTDWSFNPYPYLRRWERH